MNRGFVCSIFVCGVSRRIVFTIEFIERRNDFDKNEEKTRHQCILIGRKMRKWGWKETEQALNDMCWSYPCRFILMTISCLIFLTRMLFYCSTNKEIFPLLLRIFFLSGHTCVSFPPKFSSEWSLLHTKKSNDSKYGRKLIKTLHAFQWHVLQLGCAIFLFQNWLPFRYGCD